MRRKTTPQKKPAALAALERAAKRAVALARKTGTPAYAMENGKIVDITHPARRKRKKSA